MRYAALVLIASLSACTYHITTPPSVVSSSPPKPVLAIAADDSSVKVTDDIGRGQSEAGRPRRDLETVLRDTLISDSGGVVRAAGQQALRLFAELTFEGERPNANFVVGVFSFFIPPLAFVPESVGVRYAIAYALRDRENQTVYGQRLEGFVEGSFKGWYVARINASQNLFKEEQKFAAQNAARMVLNDIFAHASEITAALNAPRAFTERETRKRVTEPEAGTESKPAAGETPSVAQEAEPPAPAPKPKPKPKFVVSDEDLLP